MSRAPSGSFADFFPNAPSVLERKRKQAARGERDLPVAVAASSSTSAASARRANGADNVYGAKHNIITPQEEDDATRGEPEDTLNGVGSAGSLNSASSSLLSNNITASSYPGVSVSTLTPITNTDSSPGKASSPFATKVSDEQALRPSTARYLNAPPDHTYAPDISNTMTPAQTPPEPRLQARPGPGEPKGRKLYYDPELDPTIQAHEKRAKAKECPPRYKWFGEQGEPSPPPDPRLAIAGYTAGGYVIKTPNSLPAKTTVCVAPLMVQPYKFDPKTSIGPGPPEQIVVTGFDPLIPESQLRAYFSGYGDIFKFENMTDPSTGSYIGVCLIRYRDSRPLRGTPIPAAASAKRAEVEANGQRIGQQTVKVERDREGRKCRRYKEAILKKRQKEEEKYQRIAAPANQMQSPAAVTSASATPGPPPDAPKGPSGRPPPTGPKLGPPPRPAAHALVEMEPILPRIKRKPYIFIAHRYVPVLGTTIVHLQKRMKAYHWEEVRVDRTGYFIIFEDSKRGEEEAVRCYRECNGRLLFTYVMQMECQQFGNPNYERSPSPERVQAEQQKRAQEERFRKEEQADWEYEKQQRAEDLDPVRAAMDQLRIDLRERLINDIKQRIAAPALYDLMDPERLVEKRRKFNIPDPSSHTPVQPAALLSRGIDSPFARSSKYRGGFHKSLKKLNAHDRNLLRVRSLPKPRNAFEDERRARAPQKRPNVIRGLHRQMVGYYDEEEDSEDDEKRSHLTRDTEDQESRPISRSTSVTEFDLEDDAARMHRSKRRKLEFGWDDEDQALDDAAGRRLLAHLIDKDPELMAEQELEQVLAVLPKSSPIWKKADIVMKRALRFRELAQDADEVFGKTEDSLVGESRFPADVSMEDAPSVVETIEPEEAAAKQLAKKKQGVKTKRKSKKQIFEEREALKAKAAAEQLLSEEVESPAIKEAEGDYVKESTPSDERAEVEWGVSDDRPRRTVEDDMEVLLDIDGWQHLLKDNEDLKYLRTASQNTPIAKIGDANIWAYKQKEIKTLNNGGVQGIVRTEAKIEGYYVPNSTGCARTQGVGKILESEKSKYLPHRIRVQKEREEREAKAKLNPAAAAEAAKLEKTAKIVSTSSSRSNRANNRRLVNDINTQKASLVNSAEGDAIRFNQLKKRKKLVKFDRSAIHNWGLYAEENIAANDMIIEYVGEKVRQRVADLREVTYQRQGIGSSYLFRIDEDTVIDATKKGGIARFINHSCTPNCTAKIIKVDGTKRIVIYALRDIKQSEELTYDYKFEREINSDDRIPCLCGSVGCKGFLN